MSSVCCVSFVVIHFVVSRLLTTRTALIVVATLLLSLGTIDLAIFGFVFDKKADFFSSYFKVVIASLLCIALGVAHLLCALQLEIRQKQNREKNPERAETVATLLILNPIVSLVVGLTLVRVSTSCSSDYSVVCDVKYMCVCRHEMTIPGYPDTAPKWLCLNRVFYFLFLHCNF